MTEPESLIKDLDEANADAGTTVTLVRLVAGVEVSVDVAAAIRLVNKPDPAVSGSDQDEIRAIMSQTEIHAQGWPGVTAVGTGYKRNDPSVPARGDRLYYGGIMYRVASVNAIRVQNVVVRVEVFAKGNVSGT